MVSKQFALRFYGFERFVAGEIVSDASVVEQISECISVFKALGHGEFLFLGDDIVTTCGLLRRVCDDNLLFEVGRSAEAEVL